MTALKTLYKWTIECISSGDLSIVTYYGINSNKDEIQKLFRIATKITVDEGFIDDNDVSGHPMYEYNVTGKVYSDIKEAVDNLIPFRTKIELLKKHSYEELDSILTKEYKAIKHYWFPLDR